MRRKRRGCRACRFRCAPTMNRKAKGRFSGAPGAGGSRRSPRSDSRCWLKKRSPEDEKKLIRPVPGVAEWCSQWANRALQSFARRLSALARAEGDRLGSLVVTN